MENIVGFLKGLSCDKQVEQVLRRVGHNVIVGGYFEQWSDEYGEDKTYKNYGTVYDTSFGTWSPKMYFRYKNEYQEKAWKIVTCGKYWLCDVFPTLKFRDMKKTMTCKSIFCGNCQANVSTQRYKKYVPELKAMGNHYDAYHIVFTVPNVPTSELKTCVDHMYKQFAYINRLFKGDAKIKGIDFLQYGYYGAVRALEITRNDESKTFHPHFHCYFLFRKGLHIADEKKREIFNVYSRDREHVKKSHKKGESNKQRGFTEFEILLQKIWRLRFDGVRLTKESIEKLKLGYSVLCNKVAPDDYKEVFKYALKGAFLNERGLVSITLDEFKALYKTLKNRKIIQGYQGLRHFEFNEEVDLSADDEYLSFCETVKSLDPLYVKNCRETLNKIFENIMNGECKYFSRRSVLDYMSGEYNDTADKRIE